MSYVNRKQEYQHNVFNIQLGAHQFQEFYLTEVNHSVEQFIWGDISFQISVLPVGWI